MRNLLLLFILFSSLPTQAVVLNNGGTFDPFAPPSTPIFDFSTDGNPATATKLITSINANRTASINLATGNSAVAIENNGIGFSFNPNPASGTARLTYSFTTPLTVNVPFLGFIYDLNANPLIMSVAIDGGTPTNYTLVTGNDVLGFLDVPSTVNNSIDINFTGFSGQNNLSIVSPITAMEVIPEPAAIVSFLVLAVFLLVVFYYRRKQPYNQLLAVAVPSLLLKNATC